MPKLRIAPPTPGWFLKGDKLVVASGMLIVGRPPIKIGQATETFAGDSEQG